MAKGWKCPRCSTSNGEAAFNCTSCGLIRGGVVVPGSYGPPAQAAAWPSSAGPGTPDSGATDGRAGAPTKASDSLAGASPGSPEDDGLTPPPSVWEQAPAAKPMWQRLPWGWVLMLVLVGGGAIGGLIFNAGRSDTGEIAKPGDLTVGDLRVGDCYDLKDPTAEELDQVIARPCTHEHEFEMIFVGSLEAGAFPGADGFATYVDEHCLAAFETFVGTPYADSRLDVFWLEPTQAAWTAGDRSVQCAVYDPRNARLIGSLKGSRE